MSVFRKMQSECTGLYKPASDDVGRVADGLWVEKEAVGEKEGG
jgi:hypothetical protein